MNRKDPNELLAEAAKAYADNQPAYADRAYGQALTLLTPTMRYVCQSIVRDTTLVDDAMQAAAVKLWGAVKRGYQPQTTWRAIARVAAANASKDTLQRNVRHRCDEFPMLDDDTTRDAAEFRYAEISGTADNLSEDLSLDDFANLAAERGGKTRGPLWRAIIEQVAAGHVDREVIAKNLGKPAGSIRREIFDMRQTDLFDSIGKVEVIVSWDAEDATDGQLFNFAYADIG
jgi:DNA-directed RNA polymerase specialized sigma24 family protein